MECFAVWLMMTSLLPLLKGTIMVVVGGGAGGRRLLCAAQKLPGWMLVVRARAGFWLAERLAEAWR